MRLIPQIDLTWPPQYVADAIAGFQRWSEVTNWCSFTTRIPGVDVRILLDQMYAKLPANMIVIPTLKPLNVKLDDPATWTMLANMYRVIADRCQICGRARSRIVGLDLEPASDNAIVHQTETLDMRAIYDTCAPMLAGFGVDEVWVYPAVYTHPSDRDGVRQRSASLARAVELGLAAKSATPKIRWISDRASGQQALADHYKQECFQALKGFSVQPLVSIAYFYSEVGDQYWDTNEIRQAVGAAQQYGMSDVIVYPGNKDWLPATATIVKVLKA